MRSIQECPLLILVSCFFLGLVHPLPVQGTVGETAFGPTTADSLMQSTLSPTGEQSLLNKTRFVMFIDGLIIGVILGFSVYGFSLYAQLRERTHFYFSGFTFFVALYLVARLQIPELYIWPDLPQVSALYGWTSLSVLQCFYALFTMEYLKTAERRSLVHRVLNALRYLVLVPILIPLFFFDLPQVRAAGFTLNAALAIVLYSVSLWAAVTHWNTAGRSSRNFVFANACFCIGAIAFALQFFGFLRTQLATAYIVQFGVIAQQVIISAGIAERVNRLRQEVTRRELERERFEKEVMEEKARELEILVDQRTKDLRAEKEETERLLYNILPIQIARELRETGVVSPRRHDEISIMFTDFKGFTNTVSTIPPQKLVNELNSMFQEFDDIIERNGLEKLKTIGDAYMIAGGLPDAKPNHAVACIRAAHEMLAYIHERNQESAIKWEMRVGVHSGNVVAGVVGKRKFTYDVWGDAVNVAARMEQSSHPMRINISAYTFDLVKEYFECEYRGKVETKGKGAIDMYFVKQAIDIAEREPVTEGQS